MALNQLPVVEATIQVIHTGDFGGASFTAPLSAADGGPIAPQQLFTFDLNIFAPDLVATAPAAPFVGVYREPTGEKVEVDITVEDELITLVFWEPVDPASYRVKVIG
jgi:hypothetical protein